MGYDSTPANPSTWTDPRNGLIFASQAIAERLGYNKPIDYTVSKVTGEVVVDNGQMGSQWWMNTAYKGAEPSLEVKLATTGGGSADYARDWAGAYAAALVDAGLDVSPLIGSIAGEYPTPSISTQQIWATYPSLSPIKAVTQTITAQGQAPGTIASTTPSSSPGSANEPAYNTPSGATESGPVDTTEATWGSTSMAETIQKYGIYVLGGLILIIVLFFGAGHAIRSVTA